MNIANILTVSRIIITFAFVYYFFQPTLLYSVFAAVLFIVGALTDLFDGMLARKYNLTTNFGKLMDPIADKFLVLTAFVSIALLGVVSIWLVLLIAVREVYITAIRLRATMRGTVLAAEKAGKLKTTFQMTTIIVILLTLVCEHFWIVEYISHTKKYVNVVIQSLMIVTVYLTVSSGISFYRHNQTQLRG